MPNVAAIILAAGKGRRIGGPKWQLACGAGTFLSTIISKINDFSKIVCVVNNDSIPKDERVIFAVNPHPEEEMVSSIYWGIKTAGKWDNYLIIPVDHPYVAQKTITELIGAITEENRVIRPVFNGKAGHPIIIPYKIARLVKAKNITGGLRQLIYEEKVPIVNIAVTDDKILHNVNTKGELL